MPIAEWVSVELEQNYTSHLLSGCCLGRGDVPLKGPNAVDIKFLNIDDGKPLVLSTGNAHEVFCLAVDESGHSRTYGGDYFEIDLAGASTRTLLTPKDRSQSVRIFWNAHWNVSKNFMGLKTLTYKEYRDSLKSVFNGSVVHDTIVFNSGLLDGRYWRHLEKFAIGVDYAISVWRDINEGVKQRGLDIPNFIFRSTTATSSDVRFLGLNPNYFDVTWAWHFDLRSSDGVHYRRFPSKRVWKDGQIGHQYFVDLMLRHVILNAICPM
ncbi:hypothetical protein Cgig2_016559 [Carnegiea gigantea]|uniref:Uncharacterized protein n=1 Tax=Carnegiea gigantea TaxID=171969 RepID=A0A9Q1QQW1_9CARY|nr:hypothetical protein Cgig2_016559 [Carnegiea gigantea]